MEDGSSRGRVEARIERGAPSRAGGLYQTASEVVREALRLVKERDQARKERRADVQAGLDQLARGEGRAYDKASGGQLAEQVKSLGRAARAKKR